MSEAQYNPDVLSCIANLSSDEVFTPPEVANAMLDLLPPELFKDPDATFLDPACKSGVFLREIAKRLMEGLKDAIPDDEERRQHIFKKQLFGMSITDITGLLSRRSLYCSKAADGKYSVAAFDTPDGNIRFCEMQHTWERGKCRFCGASEEKYGDEVRKGLERHAYEFIHTLTPEEIFNMTFDVIISNPPYQLNVGVEKENYAIALYDKFVQQAKKLAPRYITMIIPARWYAGGRGLDEFRDEMLKDRHLTHIVDYPNATDCFPGVDISGGVCYFLWERDRACDCTVDSCDGSGVKSSLVRPLLENDCTTFIRFNEAIPILRKIQKLNEPTFSDYVSPQTPFGLVSSFSEYKELPFKNSIALHTVNGIRYIRKDQVPKGQALIAGYKVYIAKAYGERGSYPYFFLGKPFIGEPNSCCTQTYLCIGPFVSEKIAKNVMSYIKTRFFRFCIMLKRNTQDAMRQVYQFVPIQDFSKPWTDEELYEKYELSDKDISYIQYMVKPMDTNASEKDSKNCGGDDGYDTNAA